MYLRVSDLIVVDTVNRIKKLYLDRSFFTLHSLQFTFASRENLQLASVSRYQPPYSMIANNKQYHVYAWALISEPKGSHLLIPELSKAELRAIIVCGITCWVWYLDVLVYYRL